MLFERSAHRRPRLRTALVLLGLVGSSFALAPSAPAAVDPSDKCPTETYGENPPGCDTLHAGYTPGPRASGRLAPATGALFGTHSDESANQTAQQQKIYELEQKLGRTLDINNHYYGSFDYFLTHKTLSKLEYYDLDANRIPLVGWACGDSHDIVAGLKNASIDAAANAMKAYPRQFFMRYCWEMDGSRQSPALIGKPDEFIAAWRYIYNRFKAAGADNVIWVWCANAAGFKSYTKDGPGGMPPAPFFYPGDEYVEWVSADGYNWHGAKGRNDRYRFFLEIYDEFMTWSRAADPTRAKAASSKPVMIAEYGTQEQNDGGAAKGDWFRNAHATVTARDANTPASCKSCGAMSDVAAMVYFDVMGKSGDTEGGWRVMTTQPSLEGYKEAALHPWFNQIRTLKWGPYGTDSPPVDPAPVDPAPADPAPTDPTPKDPGTGTADAKPAQTRSGYWMLGADGNVYPFGEAKGHGDALPYIGARGVAAADVEPTPTGDGYWVVDDAGHVFAYGDATHFGGIDAALLDPGEKVTSLSATPTGKGYWLFTSKGRASRFGDAVFYGDMSRVTLNGPVLDSIPTPSGQGYYMVGSDGGIFAFGDARFLGSMGDKNVNAPVQSLVPDPDKTGYWLVASDGGVFAFDAPFRGSMGQTRLNRPVTGMVAFGTGYLMVGEDGGVFNFSDKPFSGSLGDRAPAKPIVSVAVLD
jgi:hypothetical protein